MAFTWINFSCGRRLIDQSVKQLDVSRKPRAETFGYGSVVRENRNGTGTAPEITKMGAPNKNGSSYGICKKCNSVPELIIQ